MVEKGTVNDAGHAQRAAWARHRRARRRLQRRSQPGSGVVGKMARGGNVPARLLQGPGEDGGDVHRVDGHALRGARRLRPVEDDGTMTLLGRGSQSHQLRRREDLPRRGRGRAEGPPECSTCSSSACPTSAGARRSPPWSQPRAGDDADARRARRRTAATRLAGYKVPRELHLVDEMPRSAERQARLPWADAGRDRPADATEDRHAQRTVRACSGSSSRSSPSATAATSSPRSPTPAAWACSARSRSRPSSSRSS